MKAPVKVNLFLSFQFQQLILGLFLRLFLIRDGLFFLIKLIFFLSKKSEVSEEVVFESFIDAYFSGGRYPEGNFKSELLNLFGKNLYLKLIKLDPKNRDFKSNLKELEDFLEKGAR
jgi:hypothetical protein